MPEWLVWISWMDVGISNDNATMISILGGYYWDEQASYE